MQYSNWLKISFLVDFEKKYLKIQKNMALMHNINHEGRFLHELLVNEKEPMYMVDSVFAKKKIGKMAVEITSA